MPDPRRTPRSLVVLVALSMVVAITGAGVALAGGPAAPAVEPGPDGIGAVQPALSRAQTAVTGTVPLKRADDLRREHLVPVPPAAPEPPAWTSRVESDAPAPRPRTESKTESGAGTAGAATLSGRNKVWIPALGIRRSVSFFSCSSNAYPGDRVYRWGCAGRNNVYLFGHAHSVFKPLHDAYVRGRLKKGLKVLFADGNGRVSTYKVRWWKVTAPDKGAFAYAAQSRPSMTLQTCVGARSQLRLVVRLVKVG